MRYAVEKEETGRKNRNEGDFVGNVLSLFEDVSGTLLFRFTGGTKGAIDGYIRELEKTGVRFHARSGLLAASKDTEIMGEETYSPFEAFVGKVMLKGMGLALGFFDEFTVRYTGF